MTIPELTQGRNAPVVSIHAPRAEEPEPVAAEAAAAAPRLRPAAERREAAKPGDAKAAAPAADAKKEGGKK